MARPCAKLQVFTADQQWIFIALCLLQCNLGESEKPSARIIDLGPWEANCTRGNAKANDMPYPRCLLSIAKGSELEGGIKRNDKQQIEKFVEAKMEPRNAVGVLIAGEGSKPFKIVQGLAEDEQLYHLVALGVQYDKSANRTLTMYLPDYPSKIYAGKWTPASVRSWLLHAAYPLVNRFSDTIALAKYMSATNFGVVLIVQPESKQADELVDILLPHAQKLQKRLKFTFFTRSDRTRALCEIHGVLGNDELLLLEEPNVWDVSKGAGREHDPIGPDSYVAPPPRYRLQGPLTRENVDSFFQAYAAGTWPRYFRSFARRSSFSFGNYILVLSGADFVKTVSDPYFSTLVLFVDSICTDQAGCVKFLGIYKKVAEKVEKMKRAKDLFTNLTIAVLNQSENEHPEYISGTPWLRFWPAGLRKNTVDIAQRKVLQADVDDIFEFVEDRMADVMPKTKTRENGRHRGAVPRDGRRSKKERAEL